MSTSLPLTVFVVLAGPSVGSFIALCADRIPMGEDVIAKPSYCGTCKTRLRARDLMPILSFALTKGRCNTCHAAIPPHLLYIEIIACGLGLFAVLAGGEPLHVLLTALMLWLLLALCVIDLVAFRLPDAFTVALAATVFLRAPDPLQAMWGAAIGAGSFALLRYAYFLIRKREGLGLGDVKLMVGLGAAVGPAGVPTLVLLAALLALFGAWMTRDRHDMAIRQRPLPFGAALCVSAAVLWACGVA
ncbi:hypothetical protein GCM10007385_44250 [Tateyamaria omphalii]|nr:hypothetical protein GCM10007385_44250 [Tateyamaria omphalii]